MKSFSFFPHFIVLNSSTPTEPKNKFSEFAGIWKDRDITQESIREQAWR